MDQMSIMRPNRRSWAPRSRKSQTGPVFEVRLRSQFAWMQVVFTVYEIAKIAEPYRAIQ